MNHAEVQSPPRLLVVTDLDGSLLDHHHYSFEPVLPILARLKQAEIPVVANTSKTRREWLAMRGGFQNKDAFVTENGSALYLPDGTMYCYGVRHATISNELATLKTQFKFRSFSDLGIKGIIEHTGLPPESAEYAAAREFSEPLLWDDDDTAKERFYETVHHRNLQTLQGGRFIHLLGQTNKAKPFEQLREFYQADILIAIGDSPNDLAMLQDADIGVAIASPSNPSFEIPGAKKILRSSAQGPEGWAEVMTQLLDQFSIS